MICVQSNEALAAMPEKKPRLGGHSVESRKRSELVEVEACRHSQSGKRSPKKKFGECLRMLTFRPRMLWRPVNVIDDVWGRGSMEDPTDDKTILEAMLRKVRVCPTWLVGHVSNSTRYDIRTIGHQFCMAIRS
jgi:hypothetical protein